MRKLFNHMLETVSSRDPNSFGNIMIAQNGDVIANLSDLGDLFKRLRILKRTLLMSSMIP